MTQAPMKHSRDAAYISVNVKLTERQMEVVRALDVPMSQFIREAVEARLRAEIPGYDRDTPG